MACMDCYECAYHIDNGGTCEKLEYDCPYDIFFRLKDAMPEIHETLDELQATFTKLRDIFDNCGEDINNYLPELVYGMDEALYKVSPVSYEEYKQMIEAYNKKKGG